MKFKDAHIGTRWKMQNGKVIEVLEKNDKTAKLGFVGDFGKIENTIEVDSSLEYNVTKMKDAYGDHIGSPASLVYSEIRKGGTRQEVINSVCQQRDKLPRHYVVRLVSACLSELRSKDKLDSTLLPSGDVFYKSKGS